MTAVLDDTKKDTPIPPAETQPLRNGLVPRAFEDMLVDMIVPLARGAFKPQSVFAETSAPFDEFNAETARLKEQLSSATELDRLTERSDRLSAELEEKRRIPESLDDELLNAESPQAASEAREKLIRAGVEVSVIERERGLVEQRRYELMNQRIRDVEELEKRRAKEWQAIVQKMAETIPAKSGKVFKLLLSPEIREFLEALGEFEKAELTVRVDHERTSDFQGRLVTTDHRSVLDQYARYKEISVSNPLAFS